VRILFLDRDGTLNRSLGSRPPNTPEEVELLPGVVSVLTDCAAQGWLPVIVSNQGGVASGYLDEAGARLVQRRVVELLPVPVAGSYLCPHMPGGRVAEYAIDCPNRKPRPGFILAALEWFGAQAEDCLFVGDSSTDKLAAKAAGVPFRWADLFFGRPIDRGMLESNGSWLQIRQAEPHEWTELGDLDQPWAEVVPRPDAAAKAAHLALVARERGTPVGWLSLARSKSESEADLVLGVDPAHDDSSSEGLEIGVLLLECAADWARAEAGLERLCVRVRAGNLLVSRLCGQYGLDERRSRETRDGWILLDCSL